MATLDASVEFNTAEFSRELLNAFRQELQQGLARLVSPIRREVQDLVGVALRLSPEYESLLEGDLREQFGLADPAPVLEAIVQAVQGSVVVETTPPARPEDIGGIVVAILKEDLTEVLNLSVASYTSVSRRGAFLIPWLEWLLMEGDRLILASAEFYNKVPKGRAVYSRSGSRTGVAIMIHRTRSPSAGFRVPAEYSGTVESNWLTRSLASLADDIQSVIEHQLRAL